MRDTKYTLPALAAMLVTAYKEQVAEYRTVLPLDLGVSLSAPDTYTGLRELAARGKLVVTPEHSSSAVYGVAGNIAFRTFHDYGHLLYEKAFSLEQEIELAHIQWADISHRIPHEWRTLCWVVYSADTIKQSEYEAVHGAFPTDQKAFVTDILSKFLLENR